MKTIKKVAIIGVGVMGGSLALALRSKFPHIDIWGYARSKKSFTRLNKLKVVNRVEQDLEKVVAGADLVVLSLPIYAIIDYFERISSFLKKGAIVIDLGSSKELIEKAARKKLPRKVSFVGCHPLCGSEKSGAQFSHKNLYKGAFCLITSPCKAKASKTVKKLWVSLGSKVRFVSPVTHDKMLSSISHLPHIISFALTDFVPRDYMRLSLASLKDLTRISNSPPYVWADIFLSNKKNVLKDIKEFMRVLKKIESALRQGDKKKIIDIITKINDKQRLLNTGMIRKV